MSLKDVKKTDKIQFIVIKKYLTILLLPFLMSCEYIGGFSNHDFITISGIMPKGSIIKATVNYMRQRKSDGSCGEVKNLITGFKSDKETAQGFDAEIIDEEHYQIKLALRKEGRGCSWHGYRIQLEFENKHYDFPIDKYGLNILDSHRKELSLSGILARLYISHSTHASGKDKSKSRHPIVCNVTYAFSGLKNTTKRIKYPYFATLARCYDNETKDQYERYLHKASFNHSHAWLMKSPNIRLDFSLNPDFMCSGKCPEYIRKNMKLKIRSLDYKEQFPSDDLYQKLLNKK